MVRLIPYHTAVIAHRSPASYRTMVLAVHIFNLLFLRLPNRKFVSTAVAIGTWSFIAALSIFGPAILQKPARGPFFGISGM